MKKMTRNEFKIHLKSYEQGMVSAYRGIMLHAKFCMKAHREASTDKEIERLTRMNNHLWK